MTSTVTHTGFARAFNRLLNLSSKFVWYLSCPRRIDFIVKKVNFCTRRVSQFFHSFVRLHSHCRDISELLVMPNSKYGSKHCVLCFYLRSITLLGYGLAEVNNEIKLELCTSRTMRSPKFKYSFRIHLCWCVFLSLTRSVSTLFIVIRAKYTRLLVRCDTSFVGHYFMTVSVNFVIDKVITTANCGKCT